MLEDPTPEERRRVTDAEFRVVRGPWPRWAYNASLFSLAVRTAAVVAACMLAGLAIYIALARG